MALLQDLDREIKITKPCGLKVLYFCPATMIGNVEREVRRWAPHRSVVALGGKTKIERRFLLDLMRQHSEYVVICNYEAWRRDKSLIEDLIDTEFDTCIIDEAHNIKDRQSVAFKGIRQILDRSDIPFVVPMTGTPILNKPQELFTLLNLVDRKTFFSEVAFLRDYCQQDPHTLKWGFRPGGLKNLSSRISNIYLRRTKEEAGIILPPKTVTIHEIEVDEKVYPNQARVRNEMRQWGSIMLDPATGKSITAAAMIAVYTRLRQIETWPAGIEIKDPETGAVTLRVDVEESQKVDYVISKVCIEDTSRGYGAMRCEYEGLIPETVYNRETGEGERIVVFSQFIGPLKEIQRRCEEAGINSVLMTGETPQSVRDEVMTDFDNKYTPNIADSKYEVVLCHYKVGGVGMNLTGATQMIILDEEWNPGKRDQAYDRIHRMGQEKPVTIHVLRDKGTIDNWLAAIIEQKENVVTGFHESADDLAKQAYEALKGGLI